MVRGHGQLYIVVAELQRELATTEELLVLPAGVVRVSHKPRKPLRQRIKVSVIGLEVFVATTRAYRRFMNDVEGKIDRQLQRLTRLQGRVEVYAEHGVAKLGLQHLATRGGHRPEFVAVFAVLESLVPPYGAVAEAVTGAGLVATGPCSTGGFRKTPERTVLEQILVQLQPHI